MKTERLTLIFFLVIFSANCSKKQNTGSYDKEKALEYYSVCSKLAEEWFTKLDSTNYSHLLSVQPFKGETKLEVSSYINEVRIVYGKITDRKLLGSHIYSDQKYLTYVPDIEDRYLAYIHASRSEDGFYIIQPKYFGLRSHKQMFSGLPEGDFIMLMYKVSPTKKSYAEERLTFARARLNNPDGKWKVVDYKISDEI